MKKRIAVTGEGPTDYGQSEYNPRTGRNEWNWGPVKGLCILCLKAGDEGQHLEFFTQMQTGEETRERYRTVPGNILRKFIRK